MTTYDFLKIQFVLDVFMIFVKVSHANRGYNNFYRLFATFCNQDLEMSHIYIYIALRKNYIAYKEKKYTLKVK